MYSRGTASAPAQQLNCVWGGRGQGVLEGMKMVVVVVVVVCVCVCVCVCVWQGQRLSTCQQ